MCKMSSILKRKAGTEKMFGFILYFVCFAVVCTVSASAEYIDPSAVTYTAQAIAAVVVAIGALATVFRHKIVAFFKKEKGQSTKREIHLKNEEQESSQENNS